VKVLLGLRNKRNLDLLAQWIGARHEVAVMSDDRDLSQEFDLLIMDGPTLENVRGRVKARKESEAPAFLPILIVTNRQSARSITKDLWVTVDEFILTPIERVELAARVEVLIRARTLSLEAQRMALIDPLTGLNNRRHFFMLAERKVSELRRRESHLSCLMVDIDHFKTVNDTHGHLAGDSVLAGVARRIAGCVREHDIIARFGGEEFVVLLSDSELAHGLSVGERMRVRVCGSPLRADGGADIHVTVSIGVSSQGGCCMDLTRLIAAADEAMYEAKRSGRNKVVCAREPASALGTESAGVASR